MNRQPFLTLARLGQASLSEKKSTFFASAAPVESEEEVQAILLEIRNRYQEANHHVYAYKIGPDEQIQRANDAGEPGGTAGRPCLEAIKKAGLKNTLVVVSRYFGGILLGAGGLTRAYGKAAALAIEAAGIVKKIPAASFCLTFDYTLLGRMESFLSSQNYPIEQKNYSQDISFLCLLPEESKEEISQKLTELAGGRLHIMEIASDRWIRAIHNS